MQSWKINTATGAITEALDGRCLDIDYCRNWTTGNHVSVFPCHLGSGCASGTNEAWAFSSSSGAITSRMAGGGQAMCLTAVPYRQDLVGRGTEMYFAATLPCDGSAVQKWRVTSTADGNSVITNLGVGSSTSAPYCLGLFQDVAPGAQEVYAGPLANNAIAVVLFNRGLSAANITASWADIGAASASATYTVRDLVRKADIGTFSGSFTATVDSHASRTLKLTPA
jgi:hypothetical protein